MPLVYLSCAWVAGIFLGSKLQLHPALALLALAPLMLIPLFKKHFRLAVMSSLCIAAVIGGCLRFQSVQTAGLQPYNGTSIEARGIVDDDPDVRDRVTHLTLKVTALKSAQGWEKADAPILVVVPRYPAYSYGDELLVTGRLETPQSGRFDYRGYLAHRGVYSVMGYPRVEVLGQGHGSKLLAAVYRARNRLSDTLAQVLPDPQAGLAQGIVLGKRGNIPSWLNQEFSRTGTTHLLAISGVNISIVAGILLSVGIWLWGKRRYLYVWLALVTVWVYVLLTGMNAPVLRGAIMASIFLFAELLGRQRQALHALCLAAAIMVAVDPLALWQASFQLSFLAMAGLVLIVPSLQGWARQALASTMGEGSAAASLVMMVADSFCVTAGAMVFVLPVIAYYFGIVSLAGPVATLLATPALAPITVVGILVGALGLVALPAAQVLGWLAWVFLSYFLLVVRVFAAVPSSSVSVTVSPMLLLVYYSVLALLLWSATRRKVLAALPAAVSAGRRAVNLVSALPRRFVIPPLAVLAVLASFFAVAMPDTNLHVSFLDVGQGDAILLQTPGRQNVLIDGGPSAGALGLALGEKLPFWSRTIDLMVLTHPHADHLSGLIDVVKRYRVKKVLYREPPGDFSLLAEFRGLIDNRGVEYIRAQAGQQVILGEGVAIEVLSPPEPPAAGDDPDNNSLVLRLSTGRVSFLLTADIREETELELVRSRSHLSSTVLKVAHHGSGTSTSAGFLAVVSPHVAVVSVGRDNRFGLPSREVMERLGQAAGTDNVYRTDEHGTVEFITNGERLWLKRR